MSRRGVCCDHAMDVVAQWVRISWTKRSRNAAEARRRNAVPVAFTLPEVAVPLTHEITLGEATGYVPSWRVRHAAPREEALQLTEEDGLLRVLLVPEAGPSRRRRPPAVRLAEGQWLRWRINYRILGMCCGEPSYRQDTLNLAYGKVIPTVFHGAPAHQVDERAQLR